MKTRGIIPTLNKMGFMMRNPDEYTKAFINFCSSASHPVLDIGAAYGVATIPALSNGAFVIANDIEPKHLMILKGRIPSSYYDRLQLDTRRLPNHLSFKKNSLSAILASRILHFLIGKEIKQSINLMYEWLHPGGKIFVTSETPYVGFLEGIIPIYEERKKRRNKWPGLFRNIEIYHKTGKDLEKMPPLMNLLDKDILENSFKKVGFLVEKVDYFTHIAFPSEYRRDGRESVGIIGVKPHLESN